MKHPIYPCFWYDGKASEAAKFYCSLFENSKLLTDTPLVAEFELEGSKFMGLNGGPMHQITPAISLFVTCTSEKEIDKLYNVLLDGGSVMMALDKYPWSEKYAWVKDKFGLTWQLMLGELQPGMPKINPSFLFCNEQFGKAIPAIDLYTSVFPGSKKFHQEFYREGGPAPAGYLMFAHFSIGNSVFSAMDGPGEHKFSFTEGVSLVVNCDTQEEIDTYWNKLIADGGREDRCGWLKDRFGVSWQIVPSMLGKWMSNPATSNNVMQAFLKMKKFNIAELEKAAG